MFKRNSILQYFTIITLISYEKQSLLHYEPIKKG